MGNSDWSERELLYPVPKVGGGFERLQEFEAISGDSGLPDSPSGVTKGDIFPATPKAYHRHFLTNNVIDGTEEWFYWDPEKSRWLSERVIEMAFVNTTGGTGGAMNVPGVGVSSATVGYLETRPLLFFGVKMQQFASGADASCKCELYADDGVVGETLVFAETIGTNLRSDKMKKLLPAVIAGWTPGSTLTYYAKRNGTSGAGLQVRWFFRRFEENPA